MPNKLYLKGRKFEYDVKHRLESFGYLVIRSSGSHSPYDLVAIRGKNVLLIQLKANKEITDRQHANFIDRIKIYRGYYFVEPLLWGKSWKHELERYG